MEPENILSQPLPSISLCIPTHGRPDLVSEALDSVLKQTHPPTEVLVSDDCGDPEVRKRVERALSLIHI